MVFKVSKNNPNLKGHISLASSKSISNRVLIIRALCEQDFDIKRLANAQDTQTLDRLLTTNSAIYDAGAAGTTFRFLTAFLCKQAGSQVLTGSERMKERPIGVLVDALQQMGADIDYLEKEGYPPLKINEAKNFGQQYKISIPASTSSQYITALLLLSPSLPHGLELTLEGKIVSRPYIEMTLKIMAYFGVEHQWSGQCISIQPQSYQARSFTVEADWSAASYFYSLAALSEECSLQLDGLLEESLQGDAVCQHIYTNFGVETSFNKQGLLLSKAKNAVCTSVLEYDFLECPDIAQTLAVSCAALGVNGLFSGLETLRIKETDRIAALEAELAKVNSFLSTLPKRFAKKEKKDLFLIEGKANWTTPPTFATYEDHRMAMAFAPLAIKNSIQVEDAMVVSKSYPDFWKDLGQLGFEVEKIKES